MVERENGSAPSAAGQRHEAALQKWPLKVLHSQVRMLDQLRMIRLHL